MKHLTTDHFEAWGRRLCRSDRTAFTEVFEATHEPLYRYAWYILHDEEASYDVVQDVFMKLWQIRSRIDPARSLKALLFQMVRNTALNHLRHARRHAASPLDDLVVEPYQTPQPEEDLDGADLDDRVRSWIEEMPERRREAFLLSRYQGLSHAEIARIMDLTPKTVNNHIVLALQHLRRRLYDYQPDNTAP